MVKVSAYELIRDLVPISTVKIIAKVEDEELMRKMLAFVVCEACGGISEIPTKTHRVELAKECLNRGIDVKRIKEVLKVSRTTIHRIKHETN